LIGVPKKILRIFNMLKHMLEAATPFKYVRLLEINQKMSEVCLFFSSSNE